MIGLKIVIFYCLLVFVVCEDPERPSSPPPIDTSSIAEITSEGSTNSGLSDTESVPIDSTSTESTLVESTNSGRSETESVPLDSTSTESTLVESTNSGRSETESVPIDSTSTETTLVESTNSGPRETESDLTHPSSAENSSTGSPNPRSIDTDSPPDKNDETSTEFSSTWSTNIDNYTETSAGPSDTVITGASDESDDDHGNSTLIYGNSTDTTTVMTTEAPIITACSSKQCRNGGTCIDDETNPFLISCICPAGYTGIRCGVVDKCVVDDNGDLCKNGACVYTKDGWTRFCQCFSGTYWDNESRCKEPDVPCFPNPCLNGGQCFSDEDGQWSCDCPSGFQGKNCSLQDKCGKCQNGSCVMDDKRTTKYCKCDKGFYWNKEGEVCKEMMSPCDSNPCLNGGTCNATSDAEYNCTCGVGFSGDLCDVQDLCSTHEDCGHGACTLSDDKKNRTCRCDAGYYLSRQRHTCEAITNICQKNPCLNDGICTPLSATTYNCTCSEGYTGTTCNIRDLCKMDGGDAYCSNGLCGNNLNLGVYYCTCNEEKYFQYAERKCVALDLCPLVKCDTTETCSMGTCECKTNYKYSNVTNKCEPNFCSSQSPCPLPEMTCEEGTGSTDYKCSCQEGYTFNGTHCNAVKCMFPKLNACEQTCSQHEGSYQCSCEEGFMLKEDNHTCQYTGNYTCKNKTCDKGVCTERDEMEVCLCPPGYVEVDGKCTDICSNGQLPSGVCPSDKCETTAASGFRCKCEGKLTFSRDMVTCMVRNVCQENEIGWKTCKSRKAECKKDWTAAEGFACECGMGKVPIEDECRDICSLESNQKLCSVKGATCDLDGKGKMICRCPPYFKEVDGKCTQPADFSYLITLPLDKSTYKVGNRQQRSLDASVDYWQISKDVVLTMKGMFEEFTRANVLSCKSAEGYILSKIELQFSSEPKSNLKRLETEDVCLTNGDSDTCLLPPSTVLMKSRISKDVSIKSTDPCEVDIKELACGSDTTCTSDISHKSFNCSCKLGFTCRKKTYPFGKTTSFIESCADIDECMEDEPCPSNSICVNTIGNYSCSCKSGFRAIKADSGSTSEKCVEICYPNPCTHGICSTRGDHEFDCKCEAGYRGALCNLQDENFKRERNNAIIVGVVLGGVLLITIILFAVCVSRLKKRKYLENPGHMYYNSAEMVERRRFEGGAVNNAFQRE